MFFEITREKSPLARLASFRSIQNVGTVHQLIRQQGIDEARRTTIGGPTIERLCIEAAYEVMADEKGRIGIAHAGFAMAALPHKKTSEPRRHGSARVAPSRDIVESGLDSDKRQIDITCIPSPRLILIYLRTEAVKTRSRRSRAGCVGRWQLRRDSCWWQDVSVGAQQSSAHFPLPTDLFAALAG